MISEAVIMKNFDHDSINLYGMALYQAVTIILTQRTHINAQLILGLLYFMKAESLICMLIYNE
jgi:hypothetical protein